MKTIFMVYLIIFKGYSIMRISDSRVGGDWASGDSPMGFDFSHNGLWGCGKNPQEAVYNCWKSGI